MTRCIRDKKGRYAKHKWIDWCCDNYKICTRCIMERYVPNLLLLAKKRNYSFLIIGVMSEKLEVVR